MKCADCTNTQKELDCTVSNNFTGLSEKIQSEEYVASRIHKRKKSNEGCSSIQLCPAEPTATRQDKIVPLEGKPYFTIIMGESNVCRQFLMRIPVSFLKFLPSSSKWVILCCRDKEWRVNYTVSQRIKTMRQGWKQFVTDNNLRLGDGCVFELLDGNELRFRVQILSGEVPACARASASADGMNEDNPIVID